MLLRSFWLNLIFRIFNLIFVSAKSLKNSQNLFKTQPNSTLNQFLQKLKPKILENSLALNAGKTTKWKACVNSTRHYLYFLRYHYSARFTEKHISTSGFFSS